MTKITAPPKIVMKGAMGIRLDVLGPEHLNLLKTRTTVRSIPYKDNPATIVRAWYEDRGYLWLPRYFNHLDYWPKIKHWNWVVPPINYTLQSKFTPIRARRQPEAIAMLTDHLRQHSGCIGVLPTGIGKTYVSLEIARQFNTPIGVLIYSGHMIDNWIEHCRDHLGVPESDVGIVKEDRCDLDKPVTIISIQTVLARDLPPALFKRFGFLIADEVHHYGAEKWSTVISRFQARYRLGMSADPIRPDGLDPIIRWHFGKVGFAIVERPTGETPLVCMIRYPAEYSDRKYCDWKKEWVEGEEKWVQGSPNAAKYDKLLMKDTKRNDWLVEKIMDARSKGRAILVMGRHRNHIEELHDKFIARWKLALSGLTDAPDTTKAALLWGGLKERDRKAAMLADVMFTTHGFGREAMNVPHLDTLIFATPPGNPLQPVGRLRDKGPEGRRSLLVVDPYENGDYPFKKAQRRRGKYSTLGLDVKVLRKT